MAGLPANHREPTPSDHPSAAPTPLTVRLLHVADNPVDVDLVRQSLRRGGIEVETVVVDGTRECQSMLDREKFDLIISAVDLPRGNGLEVLARVRKKNAEIPFILVAGSPGEEPAIEALKLGATDYILRDRLSRIPAAVRRALGDARALVRAREVEAEHIQAQKMEAIGRLAGGVAYGFNNMLTVINGYAELLLGQMSPDDFRRKDVLEIFDAGKRAADLTRQLLAFSRCQILQPVTLDLNLILQRLEQMLGRLAGGDVRLQLRLAPGLHPVNADGAQIEEVIVNLVVNARDAMPQGGKILLETANVDLDPAFAEAHPGVRPGQHALLLVSDTGSGMSPEERAHLFEPFFTTNGSGKGTGLGLSTVLGIVQQCGGTIRVSSEVNWGTTFRIYLPRADRPLPIAAPAPPSDARTGRETVLIAEDLETVRRLTKAALESAGYTVLVAKDGPEAVSIAEDRQERIHLLLTDTAMKPMSGPELAGLIRRFHPEARILFMSGTRDVALEEREGESPVAAFIQKPFSVDHLQKRVREVLGQDPGPACARK
jgi:signal transduction histidine kinase